MGTTTDRDTGLGAITFAKGHGTGNDFVILPDPDGRLDLSPGSVARLCDRRAGVGADGVLRVVRCVAEPVAAPFRGDAEWFMDYRNADGSVAEMCGNGARVFARYLLSEGWARGRFTFATRSGLHSAQEEPDGAITVDIGASAPGPTGPDPVVHVGAARWAGQAWWLPNPHAVVFVDDLAEAGSLAEPPTVIAGERFPDGQNVEFAVDLTGRDSNHLSAEMRVFERGVGETLSCGTGACAVALSVRARHGVGEPGAVDVRVPGGQLRVAVCEDGRIALTGPAVLVCRGSIDPTWWESQQ